MAVNDSTNGRSLATTTATARSSPKVGNPQARSSPAGVPTAPRCPGGERTARLPLFVLTHNVPEEIPEGNVYTFVTDGIELVLQQAKTAAGDKNVSVMGGAEIAQQYIRAGLVDEISVLLVPVLFGSGTRLFENLGGEHIQLEVAPEIIETSSATHLRYGVIK